MYCVLQFATFSRFYVHSQLNFLPLFLPPSLSHLHTHTHPSLSHALSLSLSLSHTDLEKPQISISGSNPEWRPDNVIILGRPDTPTEVVLNCSAEAHPIPFIIWSKRVGETVTEV